MTAQRNRVSFRTLGRVTTGFGIAAVLLGAAGLVVAAALPWATLTVLNTPLYLPGAALGVGAITAGLGVVAIAQFGFLRRFAWVGVVIGLIAMYIGIRAQSETGKAVVGFLLTVQRRLAPINARLAEVSLPPIEPVGSAIGSRKDHVGSGPGYTTWAGATVAAGSLLLLVGERLRHTCRNCRRAWSAKHGETTPFCPHCGTRTSTDVVCARCAAPILRGERFCAACGEGVIR
ncbi:MAG: hypothetical protein H7145_14000 [Akkermansiaceae bacterium]|nr:hypothetical protein [Armatimonadota bacterium]